MTLKNHAIREFKAAGWLNEDGGWNDDMQQAICQHLLELIDVFSKFDHSGTTAPYTINLFNLLANQEPIRPLTGEDGEWLEVHDNVWQNKRCGYIFKDNDGKAYDTNVNSTKKHYIEFPYTPGKVECDDGVSDTNKQQSKED